MHTVLMTASYRIEVAHADAEFKLATERYEDEYGVRHSYEYECLPFDAEVMIVRERVVTTCPSYDKAWAEVDAILRQVPSYSVDGHRVVARVTVADGTGLSFYACGWSAPGSITRV